MSYLHIHKIGKAYKRYHKRWHRMAEWLGMKPRHELRWVLKDISFDVAPGEAVGIIGVNGAGKSTLLKIITGTTKPTTGTVEAGGRISALLELGMGFHPEFTGRQNAYMSAQLHGLMTSEVDDKIKEIEAFAEIGDYFDQPVRTYSSGMQVRVAFSVATAVRPDILIVDEALSVGDAFFQAKCYQRINQFKENGTTLLFVSHSPADVVKHCDRAIFLKNGLLSMDGPSRDVSNLYLDELFGKKKQEVIEESPQGVRTNGVYDVYDTLFIGQDDVYHLRPGYRKDEHRWGHGGAAILDYIIVSGGQKFPSRIEGNATTEFYFKVRFDIALESVVPGFLLKTLEGIFLYGTNSFIFKPGVGRISACAGDVKVFCFTLPLAVNEGHYLISFGISSGDPLGELFPLDRRYDSVMIYVGRALQFWGIVDLDAKFQIIEPVVEAIAG